MENFEKVLKALANKRRLAIVAYLKYNKEAPVGSIAEKIKLSFRSTSKHLGVLISADILEKEQKNLFVFYKLAGNQKPLVKSIVSAL